MSLLTKIKLLLLTVIVAVAGLAFAATTIEEKVDSLVNTVESTKTFVNGSIENYNKSLKELGVK